MYPMFPPTQSTTKVTIEFRDIIKSFKEIGCELWGDDVWGPAGPPLPTGYKRYLNHDDDIFGKFENHYYFRQIGQETVERFLHYLKMRWREKMPYYERLWETVVIMDEVEDPFGNVDVTETYEEERVSSGSSSSETTNTSTTEGTSANTSSSSNTTNTSNSGQKISSDAPRGSISNIENYMTNAEKSEDTGSSTTTSTDESSVNGSSIASGNASGTTTGQNTETIKHTFTKTGNQGVNTYAHDIVEFRASIINWEEMFINEFNDLFLGVY